MLEYTILPWERWLPVVCYEGLYEVSEYGRVLSLDRVAGVHGAMQNRKGRMLTTAINSAGYLLVSLYCDGICRTPFVHTLVLTAFVGPCPPGQESCHGPNGPLDNSLGNLRWDTRSENTFDQVRVGTHQEANRLVCPLDHLLAVPNLLMAHVNVGWRTCLACNRAHSYARTIGMVTGSYDFRMLADEHYDKIMSGVALQGTKIGRICKFCSLLVPDTRRRDALYCSERCQVTAWKHVHRKKVTV